jgi:hypothetical protein
MELNEDGVKIVDMIDKTWYNFVYMNMLAWLNYNNKLGIKKDKISVKKGWDCNKQIQ